MLRKGFTLVELSIVLVIIGLIIGGILVAQSMISTTVVQTAIGQIQQANAAVNNFKTKYNSLPGDTRLMTYYKSSSCSNNTANDGSIDGHMGYGRSGGSAGAYNIDYFCGEIANFWPQLVTSGYSFSGQASAILGASQDFINAKASAGVVQVMPSNFGVNSGIIAYTLRGNNYFELADFSLCPKVNSEDAELFGHIASSLKPSEAAAYDSKTDDGLPNSGYVTGTNGGTLGENLPGDNAAIACASGSGYDTNSTSKLCHIIIRMFP